MTTLTDTTPELQTAVRSHLDLGTKFTDLEITPALAVAAHQYLDTYTGTFDFLLSVLDTRRRKGSISVGQTRGVLNCILAEAKREDKAKAEAKVEPLPDATVVPAGHYAVDCLDRHNDLDFYRIDRPTEGKWAGRTFVKKVIGGRPSVRLPRSEHRAIFDRIVAAGPAAAAKLYAQELGRCYVCGRHLTDEISRELGIGPDCRANRKDAGLLF